MDPAIEMFEREVRNVQLSSPELPILSTVTAQILDEATATSPVYWRGKLGSRSDFPIAFRPSWSETLMVVCYLRSGLIRP